MFHVLESGRLADLKHSEYRYKTVPLEPPRPEQRDGSQPCKEGKKGLTYRRYVLRVSFVRRRALCFVPLSLCLTEHLVLLGI